MSEVNDNPCVLLHEVSGEIADRLEVLLRICERGRLYFLSEEDSRGVDLFEHMKTEVGVLINALAKEAKCSTK